MRRSIGYLLIALIPLPIIWGVVIYLDPAFALRRTPVPAAKWVEESTYGICSAAITGKPVTDHFVTQLANIEVDSNRAARIGAEVIRTQTNLSSLSGNAIVPFDAVLLEREFPDHQTHLAWAYGEARVTDKYGMSATAEVVYIDAATGDPLLLIKDIYVGDPNFSCVQINDFSGALLQRKLLQIGLYLGGLILTAVYLIILSIVGFRSYRRHRVATSI